MAEEYRLSQSRYQCKVIEARAGGGRVMDGARWRPAFVETDSTQQETGRPIATSTSIRPARLCQPPSGNLGHCPELERRPGASSTTTAPRLIQPRYQCGRQPQRQAAQRRSARRHCDSRRQKRPEDADRRAVSQSFGDRDFEPQKPDLPRGYVEDDGPRRRQREGKPGHCHRWSLQRNRWRPAIEGDRFAPCFAILEFKRRPCTSRHGPGMDASSAPSSSPGRHGSDRSGGRADRPRGDRARVVSIDHKTEERTPSTRIS